MSTDEKKSGWVCGGTCGCGRDEAKCEGDCKCCCKCDENGNCVCDENCECDKDVDCECGKDCRCEHGKTKQECRDGVCVGPEDNKAKASGEYEEGESAN